jgi:hypothetical protein
MVVSHHHSGMCRDGEIRMVAPNFGRKGDQNEWLAHARGVICSGMHRGDQRVGATILWAKRVSQVKSAKLRHLSYSGFGELVL